MQNVIYIVVIVAAIWGIYSIFGPDEKQHVKKPAHGGVGQDEGKTSL